MSQDLQHRFTYHPPIEAQQRHFEHVRDEARKLAEYVEANLPHSREQSLAITKLEEAVMWANAGIARHRPYYEGKLGGADAQAR